MDCALFWQLYIVRCLPFFTFVYKRGMIIFSHLRLTNIEGLEVYLSIKKVINQ